MAFVEMKEERREKTRLREALAGYAGEVRWDALIAPYTSLKVGGPADVMVFPDSLLDLTDLMQRVARHQVPYFVLGSGSNLLVKDGGIEGMVIHLGRLNRINVLCENTLLAEGGVSYPRLATYAMEKGLSGLEFAAGIPGSVGGAVAMNAGVPGSDTASVLNEIHWVDETGTSRRLLANEISFGYRKTSLPPGILYSASFLLQPAPRKTIERKLKQLLKTRRKKQPVHYANCGSVFKNPSGCFAGDLIEKAGLKGFQIGGAQISEQHANFIINQGAARAEDILSLIRKMKSAVEKNGVHPELEVKVIGRD